VIKEMSLFEATRKRPNNLAKLYHALLTNKPTSVEPERDSPATGLFVTKLRSSLNDEKLVSRFPTHHQSCKGKTNLTGEMLALENK